MRDGQETHTVMGGKVILFRRPNSSRWQCSTFLDGRERRVSSKTDSLAQAKTVAEDWYLTLRGKAAAGEFPTERTFAQAAATFEREYEIITEGQRSPAYVRGHRDRLRLHLIPFFGRLGLSQVTAGKVQEYRVHRRQAASPPARTTLHHELVTLRQVLKTGVRHGWLTHLPDTTAPYRSAGKIEHRPWFSPEEYQKLYRATRARAANKANHRWKAWANLHDYVLMMANTGLRPDEAARLELRDVEIVDDRDTGDRILEISVRGKRGVGYCKSTPGAVKPFQRLVERNDLQPEDRLFPHRQTKLFNAVLAETGLKLDREGKARTAYSLRHTYICMRLMAGADIYQVAKNCRTSVEMIERFYAAHIKTSLNAAAINVRR